MNVKRGVCKSGYSLSKAFVSQGNFVYTYTYMYIRLFFQVHVFLILDHKKNWHDRYVKFNCKTKGTIIAEQLVQK